MPYVSKKLYSLENIECEEIIFCKQDQKKENDKIGVLRYKGSRSAQTGGWISEGCLSYVYLVDDHMVLVRPGFEKPMAVVHGMPGLISFVQRVFCLELKYE